MKLEVTSRHDHSCLLGRKASKQIINKYYLCEKGMLPSGHYAYGKFGKPESLQVPLETLISTYFHVVT